MKNIAIIEFPSNLGLKEPSPCHEPGVKKLPAYLKQYGFYDKVAHTNIYRLTPPPYTMNIDKASGVRNADAIIQYAKDQSSIIETAIIKNEFPVVIGGDCSILIGNTLALKKRGNYGLFFLDGHTDFITPELSGTAGAAGMDLAIVAGHGHNKLTNIEGLKPYIQEEHIYCVGNREYDEAYEKPVKDSAARYLDLDSLRNLGIKKCVVDFLKMVRAKKIEGFWIHVDVDVLDDSVMPCVDSRTAGGLSYDEFDTIIRLLLSDPKATGIEITILDPELDPDAKYTPLFIQHFSNLLNQQ